MAGDVKIQDLQTCFLLHCGLHILRLVLCCILYRECFLFLFCFVCLFVFVLFFLGGGGVGSLGAGEEVSLQLRHLCICFVCFLIPVVLLFYLYVFKLLSICFV